MLLLVAASQKFILLLFSFVALSLLGADSALPVPPPMSKRAIAPSTNELRGTQIQLEDRGVKFTLFLPDGWTNAVSSNSVLYVHFHTVPWFVIQEHVRRDAKEPLAVFMLGEGSATYRVPFEDTNRFARVLVLIENELKRRGATKDARIMSADISSFSAGYGAVRELVKSPEYFKIIRRILLSDSFYGGLEPAHAGSTNRVPLAEHIDVWVPFARAAIRGEKTFVLTHTQIATANYASTFECAAALLQEVGVKAQAVAPNSIPSTNDPDFPILTRADAGRFHVWSYRGDNAPAHLTHVRHMAEVWQAIDAIEKP